MNKRSFTTTEIAYILDNKDKYTLKELAIDLRCDYKRVVNYCHNHKLTYKKERECKPFLTPQQKKVLSLMIFETNKIANILHVADSTAKTHVNKILERLNAKTRAEAIIKALKKNYIKLEDFDMEVVPFIGPHDLNHPLT